MSTDKRTTKPLNLVFELVLHHDDYIEFSASYDIEYNRWAATGIGWMRAGAACYYLRSLKLNNFPAARHYESKAHLVEQNSSVKFHNQEIEDLVLANIQKQLQHPIKSKKANDSGAMQ